MKLISNLSFFGAPYLVEDRDKLAQRVYDNFIESIKVYNTIFDSTPDIVSVLELPYPLYYDLILSQIEDKKKEAQKIEIERLRRQSKKFPI